MLTPRIVALMFAALTVPGAAFAADYPAGPITVVVPYAAGGLADNIARPIADALGKVLKQSVIVENKGAPVVWWVPASLPALSPTATPCC
ncbi:hypothetical protein [Pigmentiphaga litoralis]|uniref:hypothetical protein n=1 Tax=Pigmentiphaga litoralis TaxID=516702 RepID=UPI003B43867B